MLRTAMVISFLLLDHLAVAQDLKTVLADLRKGYEHTQRLHIVIGIKVFEEATSKVPYYEEKADIKRDGQNYRYVFGSNDLLMNNKYVIMVDRGSHEIACTKRDMSQAAALEDPILVNLDSILNFYSVPELVGHTGEGDHYRLYQKKGMISQVEVVINPKENVLRRIEYHYQSKQYVRIDFEVFDKMPEFNATTFDEGTYLVMEKGKLNTALAFKGYRILEVEDEYH